MGYGDDIIASGLARGAYERGKRVAFGDGNRIIWGPWSEEIFKGNPNIARPGTEKSGDIEWVAHYKGNRMYNRPSAERWVWNYDFKPVPGEIYLDETEERYSENIRSDYILIEPNVPWHKPCAPNKDWGFRKYQKIADWFKTNGYQVVQFDYGRDKLQGVQYINTLGSFRLALSALGRMRLAILPEGGLHHGAAALDVPAVVLFGGFIPPQVTGYDLHVNITGGAEACGTLNACPHCRQAMDRITAEEVFEAAKGLLNDK